MPWTLPGALRSSGCARKCLPWANSTHTRAAAVDHPRLPNRCLFHAPQGALDPLNDAKGRAAELEQLCPKYTTKVWPITFT
jgi:hypothetical protein